jgi:hypothetical protein
MIRAPVGDGNRDVFEDGGCDRRNEDEVKKGHRVYA